MAARLIRDNIVASCICPGAFPSEMNKAAKLAPEKSAAGIPSRRVGTIEDMAGGAIYLASRAGDYVVGTPLPIDGGIVNGYIPGIISDTGLIKREQVEAVAQESGKLLGVTGSVAGVVVIWTAIGFVTFTRRAVRDTFRLPFDARNYLL
ncbi:SDR family oxidoreductase, partial [Enterococcus faecium]